MDQRIFQKILEQSESSLPLMDEMANCRGNQIGLPVNIWIDETSAYKRGRHAKRIKFQLNRKSQFDVTKSCPMLLDGSIPQKIWDSVQHSRAFEISNKEVELVRIFVINNAYALSLIADQKLYISDFWNICIKGSARATEEELKELMTKCEQVLHDENEMN